MATKTVVCPECASAAAPGRYACSECGALLAAVAPTGRERGAIAEPDETIGTRDQMTAGPAAGTGGSPDRAAPAAPGGPAAPDDFDREPAGTPTDLRDDEAEDSIDSGEAHGGPAGLAFDEDAPLAAARRSAEPDVLHDLDEPEPEPRTEVAWPDAAAAFAALNAASAGAAPVDPGRVEPDPVDSEPVVATVAAPSWPPAGDRGPLAAPEPRTPAGSYLPPSAVLPPLDLPGVPAGAVAGGAAARSAVDVGPGSSGSSAGDLAGRGAAALGAAFGTVRVTPDGARRAVAVGAGLAVIGLLLPWVNTLPGASPLANYLDRWGLAGPGVWLVLIGLVALGSVAASNGRPASWPIRLPAVAMAAFLGGLVWPYAIGGFGRSIGVLVAVVGALVLGVAGLLAPGDRNEDATSSV